jgi:pimeloyl-ACP methyl ester carboxylesterase
MHESILNHPLISERYFFPRKARFSDPFWVECGNEVRLACHYRQGHPGGKTIVHFHGNGEIVPDYMTDFAAVVDSMGYNCFLAEYRGYGMSTGTPAMVDMLWDVDRIIRAIGEPPENLILFGRSLGSIYAIHGAWRFPRAAGLILESAIANPLERLLIRVHPEEMGTTSQHMANAINQYISNGYKLAYYDGPMLILHCKLDGLVDVSHAHLLHRWASGPATLKIFDKGDHNTILQVNSHEYFKSIQGFLGENRILSNGAGRFSDET